MAAGRRHPDKTLIALAVQQPWAELILRGVKTLEVRSQPTRVRGTIYLYASQRISTLQAAGEITHRYGLELESLPQGVLVGTVDIVGCRPCTSDDVHAAGVPSDLLIRRQAWILDRAERLPSPLPVQFLPYGVWFYPFHRKGARQRGV